jgi:protein-tyrosine phosphatase
MTAAMQEPIESLKLRAEAALKQMAEGGGQSLDPILAELRVALRDLPGAGEALGPLLGRLQNASKSRAEADSLQWVSVGGGRLAIGHRPRIKSLPGFRNQGATHVLTLLAETEGAADIGAAVKKAGISWIWFPLESATPPGEELLSDVRLLYQRLGEALSSAGSIYVHCSAGIHRTGMIAYGLLRSLGLSQDEAIATLRALRIETGEGVGGDRLAWGDTFGVASGH